MPATANVTFRRRGTPGLRDSVPGRGEDEAVPFTWSAGCVAAAAR
jgi:hypothetical protein